MKNINTCTSLAKPASHEQILAHYIKCQRPKLAEELNFFSETQSINAAITRVASAKGQDGLRLSHQRRLLKTVIPSAIPKLQSAANAIQKSGSFDDLFNVVQKTIGSIHGAGHLYVYDTALRLGVYLKRWPTEVYLHAGALQGARLLLKKPLDRKVPPSKFPAPFNGPNVLHPYELENLLCCYRKYF